MTLREQEGVHRFKGVVTIRTAPVRLCSVSHLYWLPAAERAVDPSECSHPKLSDLKRLTVSQALRVLARSPSRSGAGRLQLRLKS